MDNNIPPEIKDMLEFCAEKGDFQKQLNCTINEFKHYYNKHLVEARRNAYEFNSENSDRAAIDEELRMARLVKWKKEQLAWNVVEYEFRRKKNWRPLLNILSAYFRLYYLQKAVKQYDYPHTRRAYRDEICEMKQLIRMATAELKELYKLENKTKEKNNA